ncbi:PQQ-dependent sugar dehydrogenase [Kitasatospora sp. NPDC096147]|uniref:PQQ-dependent sugar dehydrogenase n=1 Tax=Kitasatospora sp. NPDC096147 TaxID=3364093 RepID=UPI003816FF1F
MSRTRAHRTIPTVAAGVAAALSAVGCSSSTPGPSASGTTSATATATVRVAGTVAEGLDSPWGLLRLPGGDLLAGSRDTGQLTRIGADGARSAYGTVPGVVAGGEGGLLGLALAPDGRQLYAYLTADTDNRILRFDPGPTGPGPATTVLTGIPKAATHNGGRIAFGPDGMLYAGTGDAGRREAAQDRASLGGKILRLTPEGAPAPGNPFPGSPVYSLGHRNVQGLAWDARGALWAAEFGQNTWDELNLVRPGVNYGWPVVEGRAGREGYADPVAQWKPADASPSGIAYADGAIWLAALRGNRLWRVPVDGGSPASYLDGAYGRLRTVLAEPDGSLLVTTSNTDGRGEVRPGDDRVLRVTLH